MKKILFVCTGNYYRSRFAECYFWFLSDMFGIKLEADSRGFEISLADGLAKKLGEIHPMTKHEIRSFKYLDSEKENWGSRETYTSKIIKNRKQIALSDFESFDIVIALNKKEHEKYIIDMSIDESVKKKIIMWDIDDVIFDLAPTKCFNSIKIKCEELFMKLYNEEIINGTI